METIGDRHFFCYPGGFAEVRDPAEVRTIRGASQTWFPPSWVDDEAGAVEEAVESVRGLVGEGPARSPKMLEALQKLAGAKVHTYTLKELNVLEAAAGIEDVVTGDGQMLKKDRHRLLKHAAQERLRNMGLL